MYQYRNVALKILFLIKKLISVVKVRKLFVLVSALIFCMLLMNVGCKESGNSVTYALIDIVGNWIGSAGSISMDLTVALNGDVSGSGVTSTWSIDSSGNVTGGGFFTYVHEGYFISASAGWNLQLNSSKNQLTGTFSVSHSSIGTLTVNLTKY